MTPTAPTWKCPRCETVAFAGQRFCRQCGHHHVGSADGTEPVTMTEFRPVSRVLVILIVVLFAALGGLAALVLDDLRSGSSDQPTPSSAGLVGTRPMINTD